MQITTRNAIAVVGGALLGNYAAEKFILKTGPEDRTGFVMVAEGWGLDDLARALSVLAGVFLASKLMGFVKGA